MKNILTLLIVLFVLGAVGYGAYTLFKPVTTINGQPPYVVPELGLEYRNEQYRFSLRMPAGFVAREVPQEGGTSLVLESPTEPGVGIQIMITPFEENLTVLSEERVRQDVPGLDMRDVQVLEIGDVHKGLAFKSDNPVFGGASREVWFVFPKVGQAGFEGNYLYQISTFERMDPLLKAMFSTWSFY